MTPDYLTIIIAISFDATIVYMHAHVFWDYAVFFSRYLIAYTSTTLI